MKLNRIYCHGLKCFTVSKPLDLDISTPGVLFSKNGSGKTATLQAIRLAILGYLPEVGKLPSAIMKLANGNVIIVTLTTNEFTITRKFKGDTESAKSTLEISSYGGDDTKKAKEEFIKDHIGTDALLIDLTKIMTLSIDRQVEFFMEYMKADVNLSHPIVTLIHDTIQETQKNSPRKNRPII